MSERTGGCLCGAVRYRIDADPKGAGYCLCRDCQHISSAGTVNAVFPTAAITITGEPARYVKSGFGDHRVTRRFCAGCGCHLFSDSTGRGALTVVHVGTLDDPSSVTPKGYIWTSSAPDWVCFTDGLERFEKQPTG